MMEGVLEREELYVRLGDGRVTAKGLTGGLSRQAATFHQALSGLVLWQASLFRC
jgi:hypothetical protein